MMRVSSTLCSRFLSECDDKSNDLAPRAAKVALCVAGNRIAVAADAVEAGAAVVANAVKRRTRDVAIRRLVLGHALRAQRSCPKSLLSELCIAGALSGAVITQAMTTARVCGAVRAGTIALDAPVAEDACAFAGSRPAVITNATVSAVWTDLITGAAEGALNAQGARTIAVCCPAGRANACARQVARRADAAKRTLGNRAAHLTVVAHEAETTCAVSGASCSVAAVAVAAARCRDAGRDAAWLT